jgi:PPP family 3-phenylpropionic acid transporter
VFFFKHDIIAFRVSLYYAAYFAMVGVTLPFFPVWLLSQGLTPENIGIVIGCSTFVRVFFDPLVAQLADKKGIRQPIMLLLVFFALVFFLFYFVSTTFWSILFVTILYSSCCGASQPLAESLTMLAVNSNKFEYGRVRLWGSLTFILAAIIAGKILVNNSPDIILFMILTTLSCLLVVTIFLPNLKSSKVSDINFPIVPLLRNKTFILVLLAAAFIQSSHAVYYGFGTIHWQKAGISEVVIGLLWAEGVIAEVLVFIWGGIILRNASPIRLILLGGLAGIIRWIGTGLDDNLIILSILQILHGITFGATHLGIIYYIGNNVSEDLSATAMGLYAAITGLIMGLMVMASGQIYAVLDGHAYFVVAIISAFGCMLCLSSLVRKT